MDIVMNEKEHQQAVMPKGVRWGILFVIVLSVFMSTLDSSIVNVALPTMSKSLSVSSGAIAWVVSIYLIAVSATMLLFGRLGDIYGKAIVFQIGLVVFTLGSLLCGISDSLIILLTARVIQAVGAAGLMSNSQGIITQVFPDNERGRALGINGAFVALGSLVGPSLGGFIVDYTKWEYIFWINIPIGIIVVILSLKLLPRSKNKLDEKVDLPGSLLFLVFIVLLFGGLGQVQQLGFSSPSVLISLFVSVILFCLFIRREKRIEMPLLELSLFHSKWFSISLICSFITFLAIFCSNIVMPFYLQDALGLSPKNAGAFLSIYPLVLALAAPVSGYISDKIGSEILTLIGLCLISAGLLLMSTLDASPNYWAMGIYVGIMSLGNALFQSPNTSLVMSTLPRNKLGIGGSISALVRNLGMIVGITLATTLLYQSMSAKVGHHVSDIAAAGTPAFIFAMRIVYLTAFAICLVGAFITAFRLFSRKKERTE
ncbi:drug resistance transporter, EmrB/QacA subfamily [Anaerocolumna jejuensis DSM 15929]|uniref:Drug resistance transporter, EmrB/QacA subfamily n=1 Tax=Anaerocolumna jejuensis DSM 15929 TaxID=1121322 RepID=A0A1M6V173_9FIRM|nr:MFS transporter [Anaerocolumna jejuensis]SHK75188.1 drug resistance transporter, EmrB/QacA subfamily [Anaerocolumna jejuensis DSM 15929]